MAAKRRPVSGSNLSSSGIDPFEHAFSGDATRALVGRHGRETRLRDGSTHEPVSEAVSIGRGLSPQAYRRPRPEWVTLSAISALAVSIHPNVIDVHDNGIAGIAQFGGRVWSAGILSSRGARVG